MNSQKFLLFGTVVLICSMSGCGSGTATVTGKVESVHYKTKKKQPVVAGMVFLVNTKENQRAEGKIRKDGSFEVLNVLPGKYKVVIVPLLPPKDDPDNIIVDDESKEEASLPEGVNKEDLFPIHMKYTSSKRTPLEVEVSSGETKSFNVSIDEPWVYEPPEQQNNNETDITD